VKISAKGFIFLLMLLAFLGNHLEASFFHNGEQLEFDMRDYKKYHIHGLDADLYLDDISDTIKDFLRKGVYWEGVIGVVIAKCAKEGSIAVDIGAHIGLHTIAMSRKVGPHGAVIAFEPQKKMFAEQLMNLKLNNCSNVISIRKAVGETFKTIEMAKRNSLNEGGTAIGNGGDKAEMIPLDSLSLHNVSLIKIDVERYEYFVFEGARETIRKNRPIIIFEVMGECDYETGSQEIKEQFCRVINFVKSFRYDVRQIAGNDFIAFPL